jgi:hypothetical protein
MLVLVRHAMPSVDPQIPAGDWRLGGEGRMAAAELVRHLPDSARLVSSGEPKAYQTLEPAGAIVQDRRFNEVRRQGEPWDGRLPEPSASVRRRHRSRWLGAPGRGG